MKLKQALARKGYGHSVVALLLTSVFIFTTAVSAVYTYTRVGTPARAYAATSSNLNFQARLLTSGGNTVPDGYYNIEFKLYNVSSGGTAEWTETRTGGDKVRAANGYLSVALGEVTAFPGTVNWDQDHWLTMNIGGASGSPSWDGEMTPRLKLTAVPYAFQAKQAEKLTKLDGANTGTLDFLALTANRNINLPDQDGTLCIQGSANCVDVSTTNDTALTSSNSGLEISSDGLRLLGGCSNGQLLSWDETDKLWECTTSGASAPSFGTIDAPGGTDPVGDGPNDTLNLAVTGTNITIVGDSSADSLTFDVVESALAGNGLAANGDALDVNVGNGLEIVSDAVRVNQDYSFTWTAAQTWNLNDAEGLNINSTVGGTSNSTAQTIAITNSSTSGTQNGLYIDNTASSGTTDALLVLDNSDTDTAVTSAIQVINAGGGFTNLFDIAGTLISVSEFTVLDGGLTESEVSGVITDVTAGNGLTGGGASGNVTLNIGQGTGITVAGDDISVNYGSSAGTAVQGNTTLVCSSGSGDLSGGGNTITLGSGGTCGSIIISEAPVFDTSVTTPLLRSSSGALTLNAATSGGADDIVFQTAGTERLRLLENGQLVFGTGANSTNLYLSANDTLKTDDLFVAGSGLSILSGGATIVGNVSVDGLLFDPNSNLVLDDTVDIGSATTGLQINTDGSLQDIDGSLILNDQVLLGSATTGLQITTAGVITDIDGSSVQFGENLNVSSGGITVTGNSSITGTLTGLTGLTVSSGGASITGGTNNNDGGITNAGTIGGATYIDLKNNVANPSYLEGRLFYDNTQKALSYYNSESAVTLNIGQENYIYVYNGTGSTITDGQAVYINGTNAGVPTVALARADNATTASAVGVATHSIENNTYGYITNFGEINDLNTSGFGSGDNLYLSATTAGLLTNVRPAQPNYTVPLGRVTQVNGSVGKILVIVGSQRSGAAPTGTLAFGASDGSLINDSALFWDNTNKRLGIGDSTPLATLTVGNGDLFQVAGATGALTTSGLITGNGGLTVVGTVSLDGAVSDPNSNLLLDDTVDIGSSANGIRVATDGSILDINGDLILNDQLALGSSTTGLQVTTDGVITDLDDASISFGENVTITAGGLTVTGGIDNNSGGITEAGSITGVGTDITAAAGLTISNTGAGNDIAITSQDQITLNTGSNGLLITSTGSTAMNITDGSNSLFKVIDGNVSGENYGILQLEPKGTTGNEAAQCAAAGDVGKMYVNSTDKTVMACTAPNVWEQLDSDRNNSTYTAGNYAATTSNTVADQVTITANNSNKDIWVNYDAMIQLNCSGAFCTQPTVNITLVDGSTCAGTVLQTRSYTGQILTTNSDSMVRFSYIDTAPGASAKTYSVCIQRTAGSGTITNDLSKRSLLAKEMEVSGADYAEVYYAQEDIAPGSVVSIDPSLKAGVKASEKAYDSKLFGVVSTDPGSVLSDSTRSGKPVIVGLAGRVPVRVTDENGPIEPGDFLTSSSTPGVAMKATEPGAVIGKAMTGYSGEGKGTVMMIIANGWYGGNGSDSLPEGVVSSYSTKLEFKRDLLSAIHPDIADTSTLSEESIDSLIAGKLAGIDYTERFNQIDKRLNDLEAKQTEMTQPINTDNLTVGDLTVNKLASFKEAVIFDKDISINGSASIGGKTDMQELTVNLGLIANGALEVNGPATFREAALFRKNVEFDGEINVLGYTNVQSLTVNLDLIVRGAIQIDGKATFKEAVRFEKDVVFEKDVAVKGQTTFNRDTAGYATIKQGETVVKVTFAKEKASKPVISLTLGDGKFAQYSYRNVTQEGFEIVLLKPATEDLNFSWVAIQTEEVVNATATP